MFGSSEDRARQLAFRRRRDRVISSGPHSTYRSVSTATCSSRKSRSSPEVEASSSSNQPSTMIGLSATLPARLGRNLVAAGIGLIRMQHQTVQAERLSRILHDDSPRFDATDVVEPFVWPTTGSGADRRYLREDFPSHHVRNFTAPVVLDSTAQQSTTILPTAQFPQYGKHRVGSFLGLRGGAGQDLDIATASQPNNTREVSYVDLLPQLRPIESVTNDSRDQNTNWNEWMQPRQIWRHWSGLSNPGLHASPLWAAPFANQWLSMFLESLGPQLSGRFHTLFGFMIPHGAWDGDISRTRRAFFRGLQSGSRHQLTCAVWEYFQQIEQERQMTGGENIDRGITIPLYTPWTGGISFTRLLEAIDVMYMDESMMEHEDPRDESRENRVIGIYSKMRQGSQRAVSTPNLGQHSLQMPAMTSTQPAQPFPNFTSPEVLQQLPGAPSMQLQHQFSQQHQTNNFTPFTPGGLLNWRQGDDSTRLSTHYMVPNHPLYQQPNPVYQQHQTARISSMSSLESRAPYISPYVSPYAPPNHIAAHHDLPQSMGHPQIPSQYTGVPYPSGQYMETQHRTQQQIDPSKMMVPPLPRSATSQKSSSTSTVQVPRLWQLGGRGPGIIAQQMRALRTMHRAQNSAGYFSGGGGSNAASPGKANLAKIFDSYRENAAAEPDLVGIEGTMKYFQDIDVDLEGLESFAALEVVHAPAMGEMSREGFVDGWQAVNCDTLDKQKSYIKNLKRQLPSDTEQFERVYKYVFGLALTGSQKQAPLDQAVAFWELLFSSPISAIKWTSANTPWLEWWTEFVTTKYKKSITKDMWGQTLKFAKLTLTDEAMTFWNEEASWPAVIDEFVDWVKNEKRGGNMEEEMDDGY